MLSLQGLSIFGALILCNLQISHELSPWQIPIYSLIPVNLKRSSASRPFLLKWIRGPGGKLGSRFLSFPGSLPYNVSLLC